MPCSVWTVFVRQVGGWNGAKRIYLFMIFMYVSPVGRERVYYKYVVLEGPESYS